MGIDLAQEGLQALGTGLQQQGLDAVEVLLLDAPLDGIALVQPQAQGPGPLLAHALHLLEAVLQDLQRFEPRCQVHALRLHALSFHEVGLHVLDQLAVAEVRPGPSGQQGAQQQHAAHEAGQTPFQLLPAGVLLHQLPVGKDHAGEQLLEEEAALGVHGGRRARLQLQSELLGHTPAGAAG